MLKNQGSQNWMKPIPLRAARRADSSGIFISQNELWMRDIFPSDRILKQLKNQRSTVKKSMMMSA
jgi:hypothetical protein